MWHQSKGNWKQNNVTIFPVLFEEKWKEKKEHVSFSFYYTIILYFLPVLQTKSQICGSNMNFETSQVLLITLKGPVSLRVFSIFFNSVV